MKTNWLNNEAVKKAIDGSQEMVYPYDPAFSTDDFESILQAVATEARKAPELVWEEGAFGSIYATTPLARYEVYRAFGAGNSCFLEVDTLASSHTDEYDYEKRGLNIDEAKRLAQSHYQELVNSIWGE